jgi:hypothetical protein
VEVDIVVGRLWIKEKGEIRDKNMKFANNARSDRHLAVEGLSAH